VSSTSPSLVILALTSSERALVEHAIAAFIEEEGESPAALAVLDMLNQSLHAGELAALDDFAP
jgi:hypothetical protein